MQQSRTVHVIDSHTEGEPTRVVVAGGPDLGSGSLRERQERLSREFDHFRSGVINEPRGSDVVVGALLLEPVDPASTAAVIFFNDVGYLGMCGHGTMGLMTTLAHLQRIEPGEHRIETPVGTVRATLHPDGTVSVDNVPSYRLHTGVEVEVPAVGRFTGDVAWGGNWFFLAKDAPCELVPENAAQLTRIASQVRTALAEAGITGTGGEPVDHIEFFAGAASPENSARNFVLCPGAAFDRSPCGTGTSAKMACQYADGKLQPGAAWRQEGILGTVFEGCVRPGTDGEVLPTVRGRAWITAESKLIFQSDDPFADGIVFRA